MRRDIIEDWLAQLPFHPIPIKDSEKLKMAFFFKIPFQLGFAVQNWSIKKCTHMRFKGESESEETSLVAEVSNES